MKPLPRPFAILGVLLTLLLSACGSSLSPAPEPLARTGLEAAEPTIRIGVVPEETSLTLGGSDYEVRDAVTGDLLLTGSGDLTVELGGSVVVRTHYRLQIACTSAESSRDALLARAEAAGYVTHTELFGSCWRVFIGELPSNASWGTRVAFRQEAIDAGVAPGDAFWRLVTITEGRTAFLLRQGGAEVTNENPVVLTSADGVVEIGGKSYRGSAEARLNGKGTLAGVNELPLESYLYGVVPLELPPVPFGLLEAQKAQAVAARTYALRNAGKRKADGYDLLPTSSDQVYGGLAAEHPLSSRAVDETRGMVVTYDGALADTLYHSTSGGFIAPNEEVYNSAPVAYLRGMPDAERGRALERSPNPEVFMRASNPVSLRAQKNGDFESDWSRYHRWTFEWSAEEIREAISLFAGRDVGAVQAINVLSRGSSGRVQEIEYVTDVGTFIDRKDRIRFSLRYVGANGSLRPLLSTLFYVEPVTDKATGEIGFRAFGGGWGHGVGMSQTGAVGMAEKKKTYDEILAHYYRGTRLEQRY